MLDPSTLVPAFKAVMAVKKALDTAELKRRVKYVEDAVAMIDGKIDAALLIDYHAAFDHLAAAQQAATEALRRDELNNARAAFVRLTHRPPTRPATAGGRVLTHAELVALGHLGNFHYFVLRDEPPLALAEAYLCAEKFPLLAIQNFPAGIFARDYAAALRAITQKARERLAAALVRHGQERDAYRERRRSYLREMAWKAPLAGGAILAGFAAALITPSMAARGVQYATGIMSGLGDQGVLPPLPPSFAHVDEEDSDTAALLAEVRADAAARRAALQRSPGARPT